MNKLIEANSINKNYRGGGENVAAVFNIMMSVETNDYLAIIGPSGAGKSTLLHILGGLEQPSSGEIVFQGKNIYSMTDKDLSLWRNKTVGFVFQFYHLIEELNVLENIALADFSKSKNSLKSAEELLEYLGITKRKYFFPSQLSGGEKQKVAIARALINNPRIIFCDEPTGNLDKDSQDKVIELLEKLNQEQNKAIVLVTHNLEIARRAKRILFMKSGEIVSEEKRLK